MCYLRPKLRSLSLHFGSFVARRAIRTSKWRRRNLEGHGIINCLCSLDDVVKVSSSLLPQTCPCPRVEALRVVAFLRPHSLPWLCSCHIHLFTPTFITSYFISSNMASFSSSDMSLHPLQYDCLVRCGTSDKGPCSWQRASIHPPTVSSTNANMTGHHASDSFTNTAATPTP